MLRHLLTILILAPSIAICQSTLVSPGFHAKEYLELLSVTAMHMDTAYSKMPYPTRYAREYRSPESAMLNRWDLWIRDDNVAVISIRGTTNRLPSWLENFYCAQVPATGSLQLNDTTQFNYQLAKDTKAAVHAGWLLGLAFIAPEITLKIKETYSKRNIHNFFIVGHSQGAALSFLLRSYLYYLTEKGEMPKEISYKTYCSAAPKPGNLYYAYDFDFITRNGWAFTVVNAADWVPETPLSVQTLSDFNTLNPFDNIESILRRQKLLVRWYLNGVYKKTSRSVRKSQQRLEKYMGHSIYNQIRKVHPQLKEPTYAPTANYMRAGIPIVLQPDEAYNAMFPEDPRRVFTHHAFRSYEYLVKKYYE
jgi:Lipase (class 3)